MTRDTVEGFLIGVGTGVLLAAFMEFREAPGGRPADRQKDTAEALDAAGAFPANTIAKAAGA